MKVIIRNARLSFNDLFEAKSVKNSAPSYSATVICSEETTLKVVNSEGKRVEVPHGKLTSICEQVAKARFGKIPAKLKNWVYCKADGSVGSREPYQNSDGDYWAGFDEETFYVGAKKAEAKAKNGKMTVLDQSREPIEANSGKIFSGCYVNLVIDVFAYDNDGTQGVTASLEGVQLLRKGEPLGFTAIDATDDFDDEEIEAESDEAADLF